jgi:hypothetical protein
MRGPGGTVDDVLTMTSTLSATHELDRILAATTGRFGRPLRTIAWTDPELAPTRLETVIRMRARIKDGGYHVDPVLVAGAIIEHVRGHAA